MNMLDLITRTRYNGKGLILENILKIRHMPNDNCYYPPPNKIYTTGLVYEDGVDTVTFNIDYQETMRLLYSNQPVSIMYYVHFDDPLPPRYVINTVKCDKDVFSFAFVMIHRVQNDFTNNDVGTKLCEDYIDTLNRLEFRRHSVSFQRLMLNYNYHAMQGKVCDLSSALNFLDWVQISNVCFDFETKEHGEHYMFQNPIGGTTRRFMTSYIANLVFDNLPNPPKGIRVAYPVHESRQKMEIYTGEEYLSYNLSTLPRLLAHFDRDGLIKVEKRKEIDFQFTKFEYTVEPVDDESIEPQQPTNSTELFRNLAGSEYGEDYFFYPTVKFIPKK